MKIGICVRTWGEKGGIGVYTRSIVSALAQIDQKNRYILFYKDQAHMGTFREHENIREMYVPAASKWMWDQMTMPYYAKREGVDVIFHTKFAIPMFTRCKTVMVLHGTERFVHPEFHKTADLWFFKIVYPQYLRRASLILAVSERGRQDIIERLNIEPSKIKTVHLAADPVFRVIKDELFLTMIREKYRLPKRFILYVGHIYPGKNIGRLLKAFACVRREQDVDLVIAGSPRWRYQADLNLIPKLDLERNILIIGHVPHEELAGLYNLAEMTAFPSFYESFPAIPLESNACGCPVVISSTGGSPEATGDAAVYVNPLDEQGIANAILRVLSDESLQRDLIEKGFRNAKRFSWEKTGRKTLHALESLVKA